jgi:ActR/RegA family two-component response regulator
MPDSPERNWKKLAHLASTEQDPTRLLEIVEELNAALLNRERVRSSKSLLKRALLVDADANLGLTLLPVLNEAGFDARMVRTVPDALQAINDGVLEILICDLNIAEAGDGFQVVTAMRKAHPRGVIVVLTGPPAFDSALEGVRQEIDGYLVKPPNYDDLMNFLDKRLAAKRAAL